MAAKVRAAAGSGRTADRGRHRGPEVLNVHFHTLIPDGVFVLDGDGPARFVPLPPPQDEDLAAILERVVRRTARALVGYEDLESEADALAVLQAAEVDRRVRYPDPFPHARRSAFLDGFSLHAGVRIHGNDREGRERLCRYALRPPLALQRLTQGQEGQLVYRMKRPRGGSLLLVLTPDELLARLATLVPPPRVHGLRYHGVFAPNSKVRQRVVPAALEPSPTSAGDGGSGKDDGEAAAREVGGEGRPHVPCPLGRSAPEGLGTPNQLHVAPRRRPNPSASRTRWTKPASPAA